MDKDTEILMKRQHNRGLGIEESDLPSVETKDAIQGKIRQAKLQLGDDYGKEIKLAILQLIRIDPDGKETVLEETPVPDSWGEVSQWYPPERIEELERHHRKTGKPKKSHIDFIYVCRPQVERCTIEELEKHASSLEVAKKELEKRKAVCPTCGK